MQLDRPPLRCRLAVIGAGPAGLMAAISAARRGTDVLLIEREERYPKKLRITGKGRCNLAKVCDAESFASDLRSGGQFMRSSINSFGSAEIMDFFEALGVPLKTERGGRVFPQSDRAADVAEALKAECARLGVRLLKARAREILTDGKAVCAVRLAGGEEILCEAALLATGGLSYPATGSTGDGYKMAAALGHAVKQPEPSLVPLECAGGDCAELQGLSLKNVRLEIRDGEKTLFSEQGEMLFTHFGISGPLVLSASMTLVGRRAAGALASIDLKPALDGETLDKRLLRDFSERQNRELKNSLDALLPQRLIPVIIRRSGIEPGRRINSLSRKERARLRETLKAFTLEITGTRPIDEAIVSAGGVSLKEINPKTMESKLVNNLYFAGEIIDADGPTGGYNLMIAFATGRAAGEHCLKEALEK
ncbi:MAG: NAD(P)/FAD-dependent oxidoreductase [Oscillospiraceae bacterium]|nr:NAD(P)/FAD-dependent oxidoreductase [Oscillospiraceae bacterium]